MALQASDGRTSEERRLQDLTSIGPAMLRDFELLGIRTVKQLARRTPESLYKQLGRVTGKSVNICCLDVFSAAVAQARNPGLPAAQRQWWHWSCKHKARDGRRAGSRNLVATSQGERKRDGLEDGAAGGRHHPLEEAPSIVIVRILHV